MSLRSADQLLADRLAGLHAFQQSRSEPIVVEAGHGATREARQEYERRDAVRTRELQAAGAHAGGRARELRPTVVLVHRVAWVRQALQAALEAAGVHVAAVAEDGAAGLGVAVAEQPDLVLVQQQLPWKDGLTVVAELARFSPGTRVAVHLDQPGAASAATAAGAHLVFPRTTGPGDLVRGLRALLSTHADGAEALSARSG